MHRAQPCLRRMRCKAHTQPRWARLPAARRPASQRTVEVHQMNPLPAAPWPRRVYVCNDNLVPCGVVTLTDVLHKLVDA